MRSTRTYLGFLLVAALGASACAVEKTSNPLSPSVAGPIPGVSISAPDLVTPAQGSRISTEQQPVTLTIQNASTSGVRPLSYYFEVAADAGFTNPLIQRGGIPSSETGRTSFKLPDPLASQRTYYWRSRAEDGANTGLWSGVAQFTIFTPVVVGAPALISPVGNATVDTLSPTFTVGNAPRSGPAGNISYLVELSNSDTFGSVIAAWVFDEQPNQSKLLAPISLAPSTTYFWRARAFEPSTIGPFSAPQAFRTPTPVVVPPSGGGGGGGGGATTPCTTTAVAPDGINFKAAGMYNSPLDLANWCVGAKITSIQFTSGSFRVDFSRREGSNRWPDFVTPGWDGPLQYTLGMCMNLAGKWECSAVVEFWYGRSLDGSAPPNQIAVEWFYDGRWGPLYGKQPQTGEEVGIFVCSGDCRNTTVAINPNFKERSNVQLVKWSNSGGPSYSY